MDYDPPEFYEEIERSLKESDMILAKQRDAKEAALRSASGQPSGQPWGQPSGLAEQAESKTYKAMQEISRPSAAHYPSTSSSSYLDTLFKVFGFRRFREGQEEVVQCALQGRDTAVFWATGMGKSLCYQIPALHSGRPAIIISPLISLMQDQCTKLNNLVPGSKPVATFLGTGQTDSTAEARAMSGEFLLVYCTPEKATSDFFLNSLARLKNSVGLSLLAVDEAHCVSEWGHDFRPAFRQLDKLRAHPELRDVPVMVLTATAVPRVQSDIITQLGLQDPFVAKSSFDRKNLRLTIKRKPANGGAAAGLQFLVSALRQKPTDNSTIIYAPTQKCVEDLTAMLADQLKGVCNVAMYHAGLSHAQRDESHMGFLTGRVQIIVATVAFGMGIDKPDTRRVIHWGACKTFEEWYQQIGRAGRDGLPADCVMLADAHDFTRYRDDFYLKDLNPAAKVAVLASLEALRKMCFDDEHCRRKAILTYFHETPAFGEHCNTCDNCMKALLYKDDTHRDFGDQARVILTALTCIKPSAMTVLEKLVHGDTVEEWRYIGKTAAAAQALLAGVKASGTSTNADSVVHVCKELLPSLVAAGYAQQIVMTNQGGRGYAAFTISPQGRHFLKVPNQACLLPVPESVRDTERAREEKRRAIMKKLVDTGIDLNSVPAHELTAGHGEVIDSYTHYQTAVEHAQKANPARAAALLELKGRILGWRSDVAARLHMAPVSVMAEHLVYKIAYSASRGPLSEAVLRDVGIRVAPVSELVQVIAAWCAEHNAMSGNAHVAAGGAAMCNLPRAFRASSPWALAAPFSESKTWVASVERFCAGESLGGIAINQGTAKTTGKAKASILPKTVAGHVLEALPYARHTIDLARLAQEYQTPNSAEWAALQNAERESGLDVTANAEFNKAEFLVRISPAVTIPFAERTSKQAEEVGFWYHCLAWYAALRRAGYQPCFDEKGNSGGGYGLVKRSRDGENANPSYEQHGLLKAVRFD